MSSAVQAQQQSSTKQVNSIARVPSTLLQRKCDCGSTSDLVGENEECRKNKLTGFKTKQRISEPGNQYEQEADRLADQLTRMEDQNVSQRSPLNVQRLATGSASSVTTPTIVQEVLQSPGHPLDTSVRAFFEQRLGHDFGKVRVHIGARAAQSAQSVNALAYTVGNDVVFGSAQNSMGEDAKVPNPLLAHELVHVMQQNTGGTILQRKEKKASCAVHVYDASYPKDPGVIPNDGSGLGVNNVDDMVNKINYYIADPKSDCRCVSYLEINGHGGEGSQSVGDGGKYIIGKRSEEKHLSYYSKPGNLNKMAWINFCPYAQLLLLGCHVGDGEHGRQLLSKLSRILPGKKIYAAKHFTRGTGLGNKKVARDLDLTDLPESEVDPFLVSRYVRWHIFVGGQEYIFNGDETNSNQFKEVRKSANKIVLKTPNGVIRVK